MQLTIILSEEISDKLVSCLDRFSINLRKNKGKDFVYFFDPKSDSNHIVDEDNRICFKNNIQVIYAVMDYFNDVVPFTHEYIQISADKKFEGDKVANDKYYRAYNQMSLYDIFDFENVESMCKLISESIGAKSRVKWRVSLPDGSAYIYSPPNNTDAENQKHLCFEWVRRMNETFPDGTVKTKGYVPMSRDVYPFYDVEWSLLMGAVHRLRNSGLEIKLSEKRHKMFMNVVNSLR